MSTIDVTLSTDGPSILGITAMVGVFTATELSCVEELWDAYQDMGEESGYTFLVYRGDDG